METVKKYYICSPLRSESVVETLENIKKARQYERTISFLFKCRAIAPHGYMPEFVDDSVEAERKLALEFDLNMLALCDALVICGDKISQGMLGEIEYAINHKIPVFKFESENCLKPICGYSVMMGCDK